MNASHLHLILNHIPILGILFGIWVLLGGLLFKSRPVQYTALITFILTAIVTIPVVKTGDEAEHTIEHLAGISEPLIEEHEELAETGLWLTASLGILSIVGMLLMKREIGNKAIPLILLLLAVPVFAWMIQVGNSGGNIRHTEINSTEKENR